jgi:hypothetical protein
MFFAELEVGERSFIWDLVVADSMPKRRNSCVLVEKGRRESSNVSEQDLCAREADFKVNRRKALFED